MDPLLAANSYFVQCSLGNVAYSNPLYNTTLLAVGIHPLLARWLPAANRSNAIFQGDATEFYPTLIKSEMNDYPEQPSPINPSPPEPPAEPIKTDLRKVRRKGKGTNLYGRPYCPGRPLSMEERTRIIELHMSGMKVNAISKSLCISHGCVSKIISRYRSTGILTPASSPEQRRTRRIKKSEESPESVSAPDVYVPIDYSVQVPVQFLNNSPPELLQAPPISHFQPVLQQSYTVLHDPMMMQEYHSQMLL